MLGAATHASKESTGANKELRANARTIADMLTAAGATTDADALDMDHVDNEDLYGDQGEATEHLAMLRSKRLGITGEPSSRRWRCRTRRRAT